MIDPFKHAEDRMKLEWYDLNDIPREKHEEHLWADGILLWWVHHQELPSAVELASDMFDEWDDPVSVDEAQEILTLLAEGRKSRTPF